MITRTVATQPLPDHAPESRVTVADVREHVAIHKAEILRSLLSIGNDSTALDASRIAAKAIARRIAAL